MRRGDVGCDAEVGEGGGHGLEEAAVGHGAVRGAEAAERAPGGGDLGEHRGAVGAPDGRRAVGDVVDLAGDGHHALEGARQGDAVLFGFRRRRRRIYALAALFWNTRSFNLACCSLCQPKRISKAAESICLFECIVRSNTSAIISEAFPRTTVGFFFISSTQ